jgi:hypothetical protein
VLWWQIYPRAGALLRNFIAEPCGHDAQGRFGTNLQNYPYYSFVTREELKYIQPAGREKGIKMHNDNVLKEEVTILRFPTFKNGDCIAKHVAWMPGDQALGESELHPLDDMRCNNNRQCPINNWSQVISKCIRWSHL